MNSVNFKCPRLQQQLRFRFLLLFGKLNYSIFNVLLTFQAEILQELLSAFEDRRIKLGKAMYEELTGIKKPVLDKSNILHWPVLLLYAEVMSSDIIEDFCETDMFSIHLDMISLLQILFLWKFCRLVMFFVVIYYLVNDQYSWQ